MGLVPAEESSAIGDGWDTSASKATLLRFLLMEAAQVTVRSQPAWRTFLHLALRRGRKIAKVAMAQGSRRRNPAEHCCD